MSEMLIIASGKISTESFCLCWSDMYTNVFVLLSLPLMELSVMPPLSQGKSSNSAR